MARNKKLKNTRRDHNESYTVHMKLDRETLAIWNIRKKSTNMSEWVRSQLRYHFANELTPTQRLMLLQEERLILEKERDRALDEVERRYSPYIMQAQKEFCLYREHAEQMKLIDVAIEESQ